jgi:hypothetical protein
MIADLASAYGVDPVLAVAVCTQESRLLTRRAMSLCGTGHAEPETSATIAADAAEVEAAAEAKDFGFMRAPMKLRAEIFGVSAAAAERSSEATPVSVADVDTTKVCATCVGLTAYRCGCGKMCCRDCVDEEGRCPGCDGEEA